MPSRPFDPPRWLRGCHIQTLLPSTGLIRSPKINYRREVHTLADGDKVAVDWLDLPINTDAPLVIILHGLEGSSDGSYSRSLVHACAEAGWNAAVLHFRDCGGYPNIKPRRYHAGETADIDHFLTAVRTRFQGLPIAVVGYSLGGNALLKYLGEHGAPATLDAAVAVSVPFELQGASDSISTGFSTLYQWHLMRNMKRSLIHKFGQTNTPFDLQAALECRTFEAFDDLVTAPMHGFRDKDDYYGRCSSRQFIPRIETQTRIIHALDDPFTTPSMIPVESELGPGVSVDLPAHGGHVGFIELADGRLRFWLPARILDFLSAVLSPRQTLLRSPLSY